MPYFRFRSRWIRGQKTPSARQVTDQPYETMWVETDKLGAISRELAEAGGVLLQNHADREVWLVQGYLLTLQESSMKNATPTASLNPPHERLRRLVTGIGLGIIFIVFAYVFLGTLLLMLSMHT